MCLNQMMWMSKEVESNQEDMDMDYIQLEV